VLRTAFQHSDGFPFIDMCIEALVVRGAILMSRFLQGEESDSFAWLNPSGFIGSSAKVSCDVRHSVFDVSGPL
jgi:hypothetical protein